MAPRFNPPPNWPAPPAGWTPQPGWTPDPGWGPLPEGWQLWLDDVPTGAPQVPPPPTGPVTSSTTVPLAPPAGPMTSLAPAPPGAPTRPHQPWPMRHKVLTGVGAFVVLAVAIAALGGGDRDRDEPIADASPTVTAEAEEKTAEEIAAEERAEAEAEAEREAEEAEREAEAEAEAAAKAEEERLAEEQRLAEEAAAAEAAAAEAARIGTVAQQNAYRSAVNYLNFMPFSRSGLIGQLEFEGYSAADAEFAMARLEAEGGVDWNAQAAAKAADYLEMMAFSRSGLIDQLVFEGFTREQAEYGVSTTGL